MNKDNSDQIEHDERIDTVVAAPPGATVTQTEAPGVVGGGVNVEGDDASVEREISRRSRRSFLVGGVAAVAAYGGWRWLQSRPDANGIPAPLRRAHEFNEQLSQAYYSPARLAPEFDPSRAVEPRVNGGEGMSANFDPARWRLQVTGLAEPKRYAQYRDTIAYETASDNANAGDTSTDQLESADAKGAAGGRRTAAEMFEQAARAATEAREPGLVLTLEDIRRLPRVEMTTELKCIEGWSAIVTWAGARFADFAGEFQPATRNGGAPDVRKRPESLVRYVSLVTPDAGYYVGMDMASALHPQTMLCYEMNGSPLTLEHGAPLRLVTPLKYGIKHIKRVGRIAFTDTRPADFWAERGYDWYSGH